MPTDDISEITAFGYTRIDAQEVEFTASSSDRRYVAYGQYVSADEYCVDHGPSQDDVDMIAALLDSGRQPKLYS
jgi:hypothetical protein